MIFNLPLDKEEYYYCQVINKKCVLKHYLFKTEEEFNSLHKEMLELCKNTKGKIILWVLPVNVTNIALDIINYLSLCIKNNFIDFNVINEVNTSSDKYIIIRSDNKEEFSKLVSIIKNINSQIIKSIYIDSTSYITISKEIKMERILQEVALHKLKSIEVGYNLYKVL